jgi:hypothetical protein
MRITNPPGIYLDTLSHWDGLLEPNAISRVRTAIFIVSREIEALKGGHEECHGCKVNHVN